MGSTDKNQATIVFVLGLLSIVTCQLLGPVALIMGNNYIAACQAEGVEPDGLGKAGRVLGIVGTVFFVLGLLVFALYFVLIVALVAADV